MRGRGAYPATAESEEDAELREDDGEEDLQERAAAAVRHRDLGADRIGIRMNGGGGVEPGDLSFRLRLLGRSGSGTETERTCGWGLVRGAEVSRAPVRVCRYAAGGAGAGLWTWATTGGLWAVTDRDRRVDTIRCFFPSVRPNLPHFSWTLKKAMPKHFDIIFSRE